MKTVMLPIFLATTIISGCTQNIPKEALALSQVSVEARNQQTRYFETEDEARMLSASVGVLQDLGFTLAESESELGVLLGVKDRDATETGQVVAAVILAALFRTQVAVDKEQKIRVSVVTRPLEDARGKTAVRVTFQRLVWNTAGQLARVEALRDPELYTGFFNKLSQAVFLDANEI